MYILLWNGLWVGPREAEREGEKHFLSFNTWKYLIITYNYLCYIKHIVQTRYSYLRGVYNLVRKYILGRGGMDEEREKGRGEKE